MKILMLGDIVGNLGKKTCLEYLPKLKETFSPDLIVANGENIAKNGRGIGKSAARELIEGGVDCITLGNHAWDQSEIFDFIDQEKKIVRPANLPPGTPGQGFTVIPTNKGKVAIINLLGRTFMSPSMCPFHTVDDILNKVSHSCHILVDFHAETTSEKQALGWYLDGRVSIVVGTHTHVQTADERILPKGTGYLSDVGMVGPYDGVIGMSKEAVVKRFVTQLPIRFEVAQGRVQVNALFIQLELQTKKTKSLKRIRIDEENPWLS